MWEDAANKQGGRWVITLNRSPKAELDNLWLDVVGIELQLDLDYRVMHKKTFLIY